MDKKEINEIIAETTFSMKVEGFVLKKEEKVIIKKMLTGEIAFEEQLQKYIEHARQISKKADVA